MKRMVTTVFAAVAVASAAAQAPALMASSTLREPLVSPSYQIVVQARLTGPFGEVSGLRR